MNFGCQCKDLKRLVGLFNFKLREGSFEALPGDQLLVELPRLVDDADLGPVNLE